MRCLKEERRTIFDLFKEFDCQACSAYLDQETIKIGLSEINIYYMGCCKEKYNKTLNIKRAKLLFKDIILDSFNKDSKNLFFWFDIKDDFSNYYSIFDSLMNQGYEIRIII